MRDIRTLNEEYAIIGQNLIETEEKLAYLRDSDIKIAYLESEKDKHSKDMIIHGECERVQDKNKWAIDADLTITLFKPNNEDISDKGLELLIFHELYHINDDLKSLRPHDTQDFKFLLDEYGTDYLHA